MDIDRVKQTLAANMRRLRKERGLSRLTVSLDTGIHRDCLDNYEQMRNLPGTAALCKLAGYFGVTETELLHGGEIDA